MAAFPIYRGSKHVPVEVRSDFINTSCFESVALSTPGLEKGCTLGKVTYTSVKKQVNNPISWDTSRATCTWSVGHVYNNGRDYIESIGRWCVR